jgi:multiple sugar transport system permease protein
MSRGRRRPPAPCSTLVATATATRSSKVFRSSRLYSWGTILPVFALVALFTLFPFVYAAVNSTRQRILTIPAHQPFVGLKNYEQVISNDTFDIAVRNTFVFLLLTVPIVTALGLGVALLLNQRVRGFGVLVALVLLPWSIPLVSAGIIWRLLLHGNFGSLNGLLLDLGIIDSYVPWLSDPDLAMGAVAMAHVWREFPLPTILFLAGLQTITPEILEAAWLDRATAWQRFRYVTLPLLKAPLLIVLVYETMIAISVFDLVYVLTGGGPGTSTTLFSWYAYTSTFKFLNLGHGAALSFLMTAVLLLAIVVYLRVVRVRDEAV